LSVSVGPSSMRSSETEALGFNWLSIFAVFAPLRRVAPVTLLREVKGPWSVITPLTSISSRKY
jgi:hypothetical protein